MPLFSSKPTGRDAFEIAIVCALEREAVAVRICMEQEFDDRTGAYRKLEPDTNKYTLGLMGGKPVVLAWMPRMGMVAGATVASNLRISFRNIKLLLVVGVCGGATQDTAGRPIMLGDVAISTVVVQDDAGRHLAGGARAKPTLVDTLGRTSRELRRFTDNISGSRAQERLTKDTNAFAASILRVPDYARRYQFPGRHTDLLYPSDYRHKHRSQRRPCYICFNSKSMLDPICQKAEQEGCNETGCDPNRCIVRSNNTTSKSKSQGANGIQLHFGRIYSSNAVIKSSTFRDAAAKSLGVIAFEMEAAGTWNVTPTILVKGVCDYSDSHKNKLWQEYAAMAAASCAKAIVRECGVLGEAGV